MITSQQKAESVVGQVEWQSENHGLCKCPGEHFHTSNTRVRDTTVFVDSVPTIFCWHSSCQAVRSEANYKLRKLILNDPLYRPMLAPMSTSGTNPAKLIIERDAESEIIQRIGVIAQSNRARYLAHYMWDPADMFEQSPAAISDKASDQYKALLSLFQPSDIVWIGAVKDSGSHPQNFRAASEWLTLDEPIGQFITGSAFKVGTISRSNDNVECRRFLVVESDELSKAEMGAVFQLMRDLFKMRLYAVIDTAGKSLHAWFDAIPNPDWEKQLKAFLVPMGCDPATFKPSQPVRVAGADRDSKMQSLLWFCKEGK